MNRFISFLLATFSMCSSVLLCGCLSLGPLTSIWIATDAKGELLASVAKGNASNLYRWDDKTDEWRLVRAFDGFVTSFATAANDVLVLSGTIGPGGASGIYALYPDGRMHTISRDDMDGYPQGNAGKFVVFDRVTRMRPYSLGGFTRDDVELHAYDTASRKKSRVRGVPILRTYDRALLCQGNDIVFLMQSGYRPAGERSKLAVADMLTGSVTWIQHSEDIEYVKSAMSIDDGQVRVLYAVLNGASYTIREATINLKSRKLTGTKLIFGPKTYFEQAIFDGKGTGYYFLVLPDGTKNDRGSIYHVDSKGKATKLPSPAQLSQSSR